MASTGSVFASTTNNDVSMKAKTAISKGYIVIQDTSDEQQVELASAATDKIYGVAVADAASAGRLLDVRTSGYAKILGGTGGFARGEYVTADATGTGVDTATAGDIVIGLAEETAAAGEYGMVKLIDPVRYDGL